MDSFSLRLDAVARGGHFAGCWRLWLVEKKEDASIMKKLSIDQFVSLLHPRPRHAHKGHFGHVLVIGGDEGYAGAVRLAAEAALRVGAGLVSVATRPGHAHSVNSSRPEIMSHAVGKPAELMSLLDRATVLVLGPGLGHSEWSWALWQTALSAGLPMVLDADGLNRLADFPTVRPDWILTPHPGEAARLLKITAEGVQKDRLSAVKSLAHDFGGVTVLKGMGTLIAGPAGVPSICEAGNPGMATGGMGDVLSGVIGGLLAQGFPLQTAAEAGVQLHALAGDLAAAQGERGMVAGDLMPFLRQLVNGIK